MLWVFVYFTGVLLLRTQLHWRIQKLEKGGKRTVGKFKRREIYGGEETNLTRPGFNACKLLHVN